MRTELCGGQEWACECHYWGTTTDHCINCVIPCAVCSRPAVTEWREYDKPTVWTCAEHYPEDGR